MALDVECAWLSENEVDFRDAEIIEKTIDRCILKKKDSLTSEDRKRLSSGPFKV